MSSRSFTASLTHHAELASDGNGQGERPRRERTATDCDGRIRRRIVLKKLA
jgi:hypothetical protein